MEWKSEELSGNRVFQPCTSINMYAYIITIAYIYVDGNSTDLGLCSFLCCPSGRTGLFSCLHFSKVFLHY